MKKIVSGLLLLVTLFLTGCSNLFDGLVEDSSSSNNSQSSSTFTIQIGEITASRTILPEALDRDSLYYSLTGTSSRNTTIEVSPLNVSSGTATVELSNAIWTLVLKAYSDEGLTKQVLQGKEVVDLTNGGSSISFNLSPAGDTQGGVSIAGNYTDSSSAVASYTVGLYNYKTGIVISGTEYKWTKATDAFTTSDTSDTEMASLAAGSLKYKNSTVDAGEYNLVIRFYNSENNEIGNWSDLIVVDQGNTTTKEDINITNILKIPTAPSEFTAELATVYSDDIATDSASNTVSLNGISSYNVKFSWTDNSSNENHFEIDIYDVGDGTASSLYKTYKLEEMSDEDFVDGSIVANNTTATINLPTGRLFKAKIRAVNNAGSTEALECSNDADKFGNYINQYVISYNLNGGSLYSSAETSYSGIVYKVAHYTGSAITLFAPVDYTSENTSYPCLYKPTAAADFTKWYLTSDSSKAEITEYAGYKDCSVTAEYGTPVIITIAEYKEIDASRASVTYGADATNLSDTVTLTDNVDFKVTLNGSPAGTTYNDENTFESFYVEYGSASGSANAITTDRVSTASSSSDEVSYASAEVSFNSDGLNDGVNYIKIYAKPLASNTLYTITYYFTVER
ncbi:MAG: hypothetical protein K6F69_10405 [Treponema sp.]|nr:hypothetical protein [Treponema sp.]